MNNELLYGIALSLLKGVGDANAKTIISYAGSAEAIFRLSPGKLKKINGVGPRIAELFKDSRAALIRAEQELKFIDKHRIDVLFYYDRRYPKRLFNCPDAPLYLFCKGKYDFNKERFISIVGTRHATEYGKALTEKLIADLAASEVSLVSGLAFGIDICAHKAALVHGIQNVAVLAHGLDRVYPSQHGSIAERLQGQGALVSDYLSETMPDRQNFPRRNRIVAGMTDATIVIESAASGGALITADIANSYNRDVFAFPGRVNDEFSRGCLDLIRNHKAALVTSAQDILEFMGWQDERKPAPPVLQSSLFVELDEKERLVYGHLQQQGKQHIDEMSLQIPLPLSVITAVLLQLEMKGMVSTLPGKIYKVTV